MNVGECCREVMLRETRGGVASDPLVARTA